MHGFKEPQSFVLEHGYCRSVYVTDPNGMIVEFTRDHPDVEKINREAVGKAHAELKRWLAGDHTSNNTLPLCERASVEASTERILTTHVGSLPRSQAVTDVLFARENGTLADAAAGSATIAAAAQDVVRRQVEAGIDVVSDGEMSKISYATYIADRFTGFAGDTPREPGQDLVEFPRLLKKLAEARARPRSTAGRDAWATSASRTWSRCRAISIICARRSRKLIPPMPF